MVSRGHLVPAQFAIDCYRRQTWPNRELVIVGTDQSSELPDHVAALGDPTIRHHSAAPAALGTLRNVSVEQARGHLVCQWDDDDLYHPERLEFQYAGLIASGAAAHFLSRWWLWWPERRQLAISSRRIWEGSMLAHRDALGRYPAIARREDTQLVVELRERHRIVYSDQPSAYCYIVHGGNSFGPRHHAKLFARATETIAADDYGEQLDQLATVFPVQAYREALVHRAGTSGTAV
jgi:glycosyltransferase involved in cell wall biosynthesis